MPVFILAVVLAFSMLVSSLPNVAPQQDSGSPLQAKGAQQPEQSPLGPAQTLVVARSWRATRMTWEGGPAGSTVLEPKPGFVLLGIEVGVRKGDAIINYYSKVEAIMTMDASGSWGPPAGTIISGGGEKGPLTINSTRATLIGSKSRQYSTAVVAHRMYGRDTTAGYVAGRNSAPAFFGQLALIPAEAPAPPTTPLPGLVLFVYEVPSAQLQFTLKLGDSERIPIVLTGQPPPQAPPQAQPAAAQHAVRRTDTTVVSFDGKWAGTTEQNKSIAFTVLKGRVTELSVEGGIQGAGCSTTSKTTATIDEAIVDDSFAYSSRGGPGGISVRIKGTFASATAAQGVASIESHASPGPPPRVPGHVPSCSGSVRTTWTAWKGDRKPAADATTPEKETVRSKTAAAPLLELVAPSEGDVLDNGCDNLKEPIAWDFRWSEGRGAQRYNLYVIHEFGATPLVNDPKIKSTSYTYQTKDPIPRPNLAGWRWKVRPMVNGVWQAWSDERTFSVEPVNKDCREWATLLIQQGVEKGDAARVKEMLSEEWADVKSVDSKGRTALVVAARSGQSEIVRLLLAEGAEVNSVGGGDEQSALAAAAQGGHTEVVEELLRAGANVKHSEFLSGNTALYYAAERGRVAIVEALLQKGAPPDGNGSRLNGAYPLIAATENGHTEAVRVLLEAGANANVQRTNWSTLKTQSALQMAQSRNFAEIVLLLKQHGAKK